MLKYIDECSFINAVKPSSFINISCSNFDFKVFLICLPLTIAVCVQYCFQLSYMNISFRVFFKLIFGGYRLNMT
ncbi:MAG: hypothetical protein QW803_13300 [Candidatus Methanomethylicia archaeon]